MFLPPNFFIFPFVSWSDGLFITDSSERLDSSRKVADIGSRASPTGMGLSPRCSVLSSIHQLPPASSLTSPSSVSSCLLI